jgi:hypothetical protein
VSESNPNIPPCSRYSVNMDNEDLINIYAKEWVLSWCEKHHPQKFKEARALISNLLEEPQKEEATGLFLDKKA